MPAVKCGIDGCGKRLQPYLKVDPRERDTWLYSECEECGRPACENHLCEIDGLLICDRCRREIEARDLPMTPFELGVRPPSAPTGDNGRSAGEEWR